MAFRTHLLGSGSGQRLLQLLHMAASLASNASGVGGDSNPSLASIFLPMSIPSINTRIAPTKSSPVEIFPPFNFISIQSTEIYNPAPLYLA